MKIFVDANVIIYTRDANAPEKRAKANRWLAALAKRNCGVISPQIAGEVCRVLIEKLHVRDAAVLNDMVDRLSEWTMTVHDMGVIRDAVAIKLRWGFRWWDCVHVAAAQRAECQILLTEDLQDRQELGGLVVLNPFTTEPSLVFQAE